MGQVTIVLDDAAAAAVREAAATAGVSQNRWLVDLIRRHFLSLLTAATSAPILIVDDDPFCRESLQSLVEDLGWRADLAEDGASGLALLAERDYRLLLTDCRMPFVDGFQLTRAVREMERRKDVRRLPIIAVTGEFLDGGDEGCRELGLDGYLRKPFAPGALAAVLGKWLEGGSGNETPPARAAMPLELTAPWPEE